MKNNRLLYAIGICSFLGIAVSLYLTWVHYSTGPTFCKIGGAINCDLVNRGPYGEILGFPVSGIGFLGYVFIAALALLLLSKNKNARIILTLLRTATTLGFLFSLWLLYLELFVILAVCPFCMISLLLITIITTLAWTACPVPNRWSNGSGAGVDPQP
ncbi:MAG: vitamin K epoxide reductase family protein [bacterium]|nr:vitamin K epoxide reductase family protein [bacterium]